MEEPLVRRGIHLSKGNALFRRQDVRLGNGQSGVQLLALKLWDNILKVVKGLLSVKAESLLAMIVQRRRKM